MRKKDNKPSSVQEVWVKPYLDEQIHTETLVNATVYFINSNENKGVLDVIKEENKKGRLPRRQVLEKVQGGKLDIKRGRTSKRQKINS